MTDFRDPDDYNAIMDFITTWEAEQAQALGELLGAHFRPRSVIDAGCGPGLYLIPFRQRGAWVFGVDGASGAGRSLEPLEFSIVDLRQPWHPPTSFDLALCIEVAEHLEPQYSDTLVDTLCRCAPLIFFSAAHPGQGDGGLGQGHWNEQPPAYWLEKFTARGYHLPPENDGLLHTINTDPAYARVGWLRQNAMLLAR